MNKLTCTLLSIALSTTLANAQTPAPKAAPGAPVQVLNNAPAGASTITHWYKQNVYDPADNKIGEVKDVLLDREGKTVAFIVAVGGFLGAGEKDVAVPFNAIHFTDKNNNKWYMVMNTTKDAMKAAPGLKYDRNSMTWIPEGSTTGGPAPAPR
jgi:sporulation protein YlmC with PRC-barrel domain